MGACGYQTFNFSERTLIVWMRALINAETRKRTGARVGALALHPGKAQCRVPPFTH